MDTEPVKAIGQLPGLGPNEPLIGAPHSRSKLMTPALLLDLDRFEANLGTMAARCAKAGLSLRPHAKTHKSSHIAKLQMCAGALGVCAATLREAIVMLNAGLPSVLLTTPVVGEAKIAALLEAIHETNDLKVVVDNSSSIDALESALKERGKHLDVLVDVDMGMKRTGVPDIAGVHALVRRIASSSSLRWSGIQAYSGMIQHVGRHSDRILAYQPRLNQLKALLSSLRALGLDPPIVSGGGTGSFDLDRGAGVFTEVQCGSYLFMDLEYEAVQLFAQEPNPYDVALSVQCTVLSSNWPGSVTIDGGSKSFSAGGPVPRVMAGAPPDTVYEFAGDEFGKLLFTRDESALALASKVELVTPHCDPTVNLHSYYHCVRHGKLEAIWPIDARGSL
jgi:3-hydroxy-D-aspartate aldolase